MSTSQQMEAAASGVWKRYRRTRSPADRNRLVEIYQPLLAIWARKINLPDWAELDRDDLQSAGCFGLMEAIDSFEPARGITFSAFSGLRIRGAMLDHVRQMDWVPRLERQRQKKGECEPIALVRLSQLPSINPEKTAEMEIPDRRADPPGQRLDIQSWWQEMLRDCSHRDRLLLLLLYREGLTMRQVGIQLQISESRVSQRHGMLIARARERLQPADLARTPKPVKSPSSNWNRIMNEKAAINLPERMALNEKPSEERSATAFFESLNRRDVEERIEHHRQELAAWQQLLQIVQARESGAAVMEERSPGTRRKDTPERIEQLLREHSALRPKEIADSLGLSAANVYACLKRHVDRFSKTAEGLWKVA